MRSLGRPPGERARVPQAADQPWGTRAATHAERAQPRTARLDPGSDVTDSPGAAHGDGVGRSTATTLTARVGWLADHRDRL